MSQVRKLQPGGNTNHLIGVQPLEFKTPELSFENPQQTPSKKYGVLTIDGQDYEATPEMIMDLSQYLSRYGDRASTLAGLTAALQNGQNVRYDTIGNTITGMDGLWAGTNDKTNDRRRLGGSRWRKKWEAITNSDAHQFRDALKLLSNYRYAPKASSDSASNPSDLTDIFGDRVFYKYKENEDGTKSLLKDATENLAIDSRLNNITKFLGMSEDEAKKLYRLDDNFYTKQRLAGLRQLYAQNRSVWDTRLEEIRKRAETGNLNEDDLAFLENFNIGKDDNAESIASGKLSAKDKQEWRNAGYGDLIPGLNGKAHLENGVLVLNDGESWGFNLGDLEGKNIFFNDDFYQSKYGLDSSLSPYRNFTLYGNKLYSLNNPELAKILNVEGGYNQLMENGNWSGAQDQILTRFTDAARENPGTLGNNAYSSFFNGKHYMFSNLTGLLDPVDPALKGKQVVSYYDLDEDSKNGPYRRYTAKYAVLDERGNLIKDGLSLNDFTKIKMGKSAGALKTYSRVHDTGNTNYDGRYYEDIKTSTGKDTGFRVYYSPDGSNDVILHMPRFYADGINADEEDIRLPKELADVLFSNPKLWDNVHANARNKANFMRLISSLVQSKARHGNYDLDWKLLYPSRWKYLAGSNQRSVLKELGFTGDALNAMDNAIYNATRGNRNDRRENYIVSAPTLQKNGGRIVKNESHVFQYGGIAGGSQEAVGVSEKRISQKQDRNQSNSAGIIGDTKNWTNADTEDVAALVADIGGLGLAFVPGANIASAVTGAAGSTARLAADLERNTKGAGWNYLVNLGMDAATLLPIVGGAGKTYKIARAVRKGLPTIIKAASVFGLGSAVVNTANKIANGEKFTVRDVDMVVNALTAGVALSKSGGLGKTKKVEKFKDISIKNKTVTGENGAVNPVEGTKPFDIAGNDLQNVKTPEAFKKLVVDKAKAAGDNNVTLENVENRYDLSSFISNSGKKWAPGWNPKTWFKKSDSTKLSGLESKKVAQESESELGRWWRGEGSQREAYNAQLRGEEPTVTVTRTTTRVYEPKKIKFKGEEITFTPEEVEALAHNRNSKSILQNKLKSDNKEDWTELFRMFNRVKNKTRIVTKSDPVPDWFVRRISDTKWKQPGLGIKIGPVSSRTRVYDLRQNISVPQWINSFTDGNYQRNINTQPIYPPVTTFDSVINDSMSGNEDLNIDPKFLELLQNNYFQNIPAHKKGGKVVKAVTGTSLPTVVATKKWLDDMHKRDAEEVATAETTSVNQGGKNNGNSSNNQGGENENAAIPDYITPIGNTINAGFALHDVNRQLNNFLKRDRYHMSTPLTNAPRFISSGTGDAYRTAAKRVLMNKPVTSNAIVNNADDLQRQQRAFDYEMQGSLADAKEFAQHMANLQDYQNKVALRNTEIANQNRNYDVQYNYQNILQKNANIAEKRRIKDQWAYGMLDYANKARLKHNAEAFAIEHDNELDNIDAWRSAELAKIDSMDHDSEAYRKALNAINDGVKQRYRNLQLKQYAFMKKGGNTGKNARITYSRDPYPELLLENAKHVSKLVDKLNDATIKLLLQVKPIHVS